MKTLLRQSDLIVHPPSLFLLLCVFLFCILTHYGHLCTIFSELFWQFFLPKRHQNVLPGGGGNMQKAIFYCVLILHTLSPYNWTINYFSQERDKLCCCWTSRNGTRSCISRKVLFFGIITNNLTTFRPSGPHGKLLNG